MSMRFSNKTIIKHISDFLFYCKEEKSLLPKSIENYSRFLNKFIDWLKQNKLQDLKPHQLSPSHIWDYRVYLARQSKKTLKKSTQNYYLIAIRSLLSYFIEKNIQSLLPDKVSLLKEDKIKKSVNLISQDQILKLISAPDILKLNGLRDRTILELLISSGLKINQLIALDKKDVKFKPYNYSEIKVFNKKDSYFETISLGENATNWLRKYLNTRDDKETALFINYQRKKNASRRLTDRSIERNIRKYVKDNNLSFQFTPESLRNVYISRLLKEQEDIKIKSPFRHKSLQSNIYKLEFKNINNFSKKNNCCYWYNIERAINDEIAFLKENIITISNNYKKERLLNNCDNCILRRLAILIVSNKVKVIKIKARNNKTLWNVTSNKKNLTVKSRHGKNWHRKVMAIISRYFSQSYKIVYEPNLNYGRADLGLLSKNNQKNMLAYIEVGTISLFKLWYNLSTMGNNIFLIVPSEKYLIEFRI